jgi:hypothetical protein
MKRACLFTLLLILPGRLMAQQQAASPQEHLDQVFTSVAQEYRGVRQTYKPVPLLEGRFDAYHKLRQWSLKNYDWRPSLRASLPLESLAVEVAELAEGGQRERQRADSCLQAAVARLKDPDPKQRALAAEFLAMVPEPTLEQGLIESLAPLLADKAPAWDGLRVYSGQRAGNVSVHPAGLMVSQVAQSALATLTPHSFTDAEAVRLWWRSHRNVRAHPWYWAARWRRIRPETDLAALAPLGPDQGLRMLLVAGIQEAVVTEARQLDEGAALPPDRTGGTWLETPYTLNAAALFAYRHRLNDTLLGIVAGQIPWPEARGPNAAGRLSDQAAGVLEQTATAEDLPRIEQLLAEPPGPLKERADLQIRLIRLVANRLPGQSEAILVSQLKRHPELHLLAGDLLQQFGLKHWPLVKASYATESGEPDHRHELIPMVLHVAGDEARGRLAELLVLDNLSGPGPLEERYRQSRLQRFVQATDALDGAHVLTKAEDWAPIQTRFQRFVQAAGALNGAPVITEAEERAAMYLWGKGSRQTEAEIAMVPENRRKAVDKLLAFFTGRGPGQ